jgi:hypothetical protein
VEDPILSEWNSKTIEMKVFGGTTNEYSRDMDQYDAAFSINAACAWVDIPRFTAEMLKLKNEFTKSGMTSILPSIDQLHDADGSRTSKCPEPRVVLGDLLE